MYEEMEDNVINEKEKIETNDDLRLPKSNNHIGNIYFNGFAIGFSSTDASIEITAGGEEIGRLIMPFGTLKSLGESISEQIEYLEGAIGPIYSIDVATKKLAELSKKQKE